MTSRRWSIVAAATAGCLAVAVALSVAGGAVLASDYPAAPKAPVTDAYHGVKVTDDYRWLENGELRDVRAHRTIGLERPATA